MPAKWSERGIDNLRRQNVDTRDTNLAVYRNNVALPAQLVALRLVNQQGTGGEVQFVPGALLQVRGAFGLDIRADDEFIHQGFLWKVLEPGVATETNSSVVVRVLAELIGKAQA